MCFHPGHDNESIEKLNNLMEQDDDIFNIVLFRYYRDSASGIMGIGGDESRDNYRYQDNNGKKETYYYEYVIGIQETKPDDTNLKLIHPYTNYNEKIIKDREIEIEKDPSPNYEKIRIDKNEFFYVSLKKDIIDSIKNENIIEIIDINDDGCLIYNEEGMENSTTTTTLINIVEKKLDNPTSFNDSKFVKEVYRGYIPIDEKNKGEFFKKFIETEEFKKYLLEKTKPLLIERYKKLIDEAIIPETAAKEAAAAAAAADKKAADKEAADKEAADKEAADKEAAAAAAAAADKEKQKIVLFKNELSTQLSTYFKLENDKLTFNNKKVDDNEIDGILKKIKENYEYYEIKDVLNDIIKSILINISKNPLNNLEKEDMINYINQILDFKIKNKGQLSKELTRKEIIESIKKYHKNLPGSENYIDFFIIMYNKNNDTKIKDDATKFDQSFLKFIKSVNYVPDFNFGGRRTRHKKKRKNSKKSRGKYRK